MPFNPLMKSVGEKPNLWPSVILSISIPFLYTSLEYITNMQTHSDSL